MYVSRLVSTNGLLGQWQRHCNRCRRNVPWKHELWCQLLKMWKGVLADWHLVTQRIVAGSGSMDEICVWVVVRWATMPFSVGWELLGGALGIGCLRGCYWLSSGCHDCHPNYGMVPLYIRSWILYKVCMMAIPLFVLLIHMMMDSFACQVLR